MGKPYLERRAACPVCGSGDGEPIYELSYEAPEMMEYLVGFYQIDQAEVLHYLKGETYRVIACDRCSLVYQEDIPTDEMMGILYEKWIDPSIGYHDAVNSRSPSFFMRLAHEHYTLLRYFDQKSDQLQFFDFGMGWGTWCKLGNGFGIKTYGAELSKARIAHCRKHGIEVVALDDVDQYSFDVINSDQVFEHLANPFEILSQLVKGLRSGGIFHVFVPNGFDIRRRLKYNNWNIDKKHPMSLNPIAPLEHINCYNYDSLVYMANRLSLKLIDLDLEPKHEKGHKENIKSLLRPVKDLLVPNPYPYKSTNLCFQKVGQE